MPLFTPGTCQLTLIQNIASTTCKAYEMCVCECTHSTFRDQTSDSQRAHFPNVNISVKTRGVGVNRILLNCERLRAPLSPRWHRASGENQPRPPRFLQHCPFIKGKPPTAFLDLGILHRCSPFLLNRDAPPFRLYRGGCLAPVAPLPRLSLPVKTVNQDKSAMAEKKRAWSTSLFSWWQTSLIAKVGSSSLPYFPPCSPVSIHQTLQRGGKTHIYLSSDPITVGLSGGGQKHHRWLTNASDR